MKFLISVKKPRSARFLNCTLIKKSGSLNVGSLLAFRALRDFKLNFLTFFQGLETIHLDCRKMCEKVFAAIVRSNEAETFGIIEPLNCTCCHKSVFQVLLNHTSRQSKKPRGTQPPLKTCSLYIDRTSVDFLSTKFILRAKNKEVKIFCYTFLSSAKGAVATIKHSCFFDVGCHLRLLLKARNMKFNEKARYIFDRDLK